MDDILVSAPLAGWVLPLDVVPDVVFAGRMLGDGLAIDPTGDTLCAPCDATIVSIHAARHALTLRLDGGAELLIHVGLDTVALGGAGFTPLVAAGAAIRRGDALLRFDLDALVRSARAVVTPVIVADPERWMVTPVAGEGPIAIGDPLFRVAPREGAMAIRTDADVAGVSVRRDVTVALPHGLHARPAARIAAAARGATVTLRHGDASAAAASPTALLALGAGHGAAIVIEASGSDAATAAEAVVRVLLDDSAEQPAPVAPPPALPDDAPGLRGVAAAPGLAIGPAAWFRHGELAVAEAGEGIEVEAARLDAALATVRRELEAVDGAGTPGAVASAHRALLDDPALLAETCEGIAAGRSAAAAYRAALRAQARALAASPDRRIAERADDLRDVERRVVAALLGVNQDGPAIAAGSIVLAHELFPSDMAALQAARPAGIALVAGGPTSHVAILAAGAGLPLAVAFGPALEAVTDGETLLLDADHGLLEASPPADRLAAARTAAARREAEEAAARSVGAAPCRTADGTRIEVFANLGSVADARAAVQQGAEGCGLLRTEFLFLDRAEPPDAARQAADYQAIADALGDRPLIVRLLDVGGDKPAPYLDLAPEENPALGLRGVRVALARPAILDAQLRAILSVAPAGRCRIMVPMVAGVAELEAVVAAVATLRDELGIAAPVEVGAMVETPAAALTADLLAGACAFLSIGSNDLTQYALAMDRGNPAVAAGVDGLHPAVLRLIAATCDGAAGRVPVGVCGGLAADPLAVPILLGLGVGELSVPLARVAATKALVARLSLADCRAHARAALALASPGAVRDHAAAFAERMSA